LRLRQADDASVTEYHDACIRVVGEGYAREKICQFTDVCQETFGFWYFGEFSKTKFSVFLGGFVGLRLDLTVAEY
jgi:hypothetical protein